MNTKVKSYLIFCLIIIVSGVVEAQEAVLCPLQKDNIKIETTVDIPTVTNNPDGTVTLTHSDQNITDIFAQYTIHDFYQSFPSSNPDGELFKYYTLVHENRTLINELYNYVHPSIYLLDPYPNTTISSALINLLDNKTYKLIKYCTESSELGWTCPESDQQVPDDFELKIAFEYDAVNDLIHAETVGVSSCGNSFSINMKGGFDDGFGTTDNTLQLWESETGNSALLDYNQPCHNIESMLYSVLDIGCYENHNYGNIRVYANSGETGQIVIERANVIFATDFLTFQDNALSVNDESFQNIKLFEIVGNPYLQIANLNNQSVSVEIYNTSVQLIERTKRFKENTLNISNLSSGLYFVKLSNLNNQQKVFKFLKN